MLLEIRDITKSYTTKNGLFMKYTQQVLKGVSLQLEHGECLGIVGESGSGKSTLGKVILGLEAADSGTVHFAPEVAGSALQRSVVFQDYTTSLNPRLLIGESIAEPLLRLGLNAAIRKKRTAELLTEVGLSTDLAGRYPHQLSGGQLQRVCIARAIAPKPSFILFDEAVSSLDVTVQAQILDLMVTLKEQHKIAFIFITHDITVATYVCDKLIFFKDGLISERLDDLRQLPHVQDDYAITLLQAAHFLEEPFARRMTHAR